MVFSASSALALSSAKYGHDPLYFFYRQLSWASLGLVLLWFFTIIPYANIQKFYRTFFPISLILIIIVPFVGQENHGARSWFGIGSLGIQPTEFIKLFLILYLGIMITRKGEKFRLFKSGLLPVFAMVSIVCGLIMLQPDFGSTMIIFTTSIIIMVVGGARFGHLFFIALLLGMAAYMTIKFGHFDSESIQYKIERFKAVLDPTSDETDSTYQLSRSLQALGHGGFFGTGYGDGIQKIKYLPFAYSDFIFSVIAEEFGFFGSTIFLLSYILFIWRGMVVSLRCADYFGKIVGIGIVSLLGLQAFINIGGVIGLIPLTGVTLPLISHGGSSLLITLVSLGILLNISRGAPAGTIK